jgi:uncharacterized protein (DUF2126 family)
MPPHARNEPHTQLLLRALIRDVLGAPYESPLARWGTELHDRFMLPHFRRAGLRRRPGGSDASGWPIPARMVASAHLEFRFPPFGSNHAARVHVELRQALEPWHVTGEGRVPGGTARYVDSFGRASSSER